MTAIIVFQEGIYYSTPYDIFMPNPTNENYKVVKGIDLWQSAKLLFARAKEVKDDINKLK